MGRRPLSDYRIKTKKLFEKDLERVARRDSVLAERVNRRRAKLAVNPKHHVYHAGGAIRCNWVAGVGDWALVYEVIDAEREVILLRLLSLDEV